VQPGHYSADQPNPNLKTFVDQHLRIKPYDARADSYSVSPFNKPLQATKATAIYSMHSYHQGKKPHDAIRAYIRHYTQPGDLVLDPFAGSGGTALAAILDGRDAIAVDRSPAATFIVKNYCTPIAVGPLKISLSCFQNAFRPELDWLYETKCDRCGGPATTAFTVYSHVFKCERCLKEIPLFDCVPVEQRAANGAERIINACPVCHVRGIVEEISTRRERLDAIPVEVSYLCQGDCRPKRSSRRHDDPDKRKRHYFERWDLGKLEEISRHAIPYWYPTDRMMHAPEGQERWGVKWRAGTSNFRTVDALFTKRNLWALAAIRAAAENVTVEHRDLAFAALTGAMLHLSRMSHHKEGGGGIMVGTYYLPQMFKERNAAVNVADKLGEIVSALESDINHVSGKAMISTQSATVLDQIASNSIDYIFTDPPYGDRVQYGELNFIWESWLKFDTHWHDEEIIVNDVRGRTEEDWATMMSKAVAHCFRVLKPGRWLSLCYHDTSEGTWSLIQDIMAEAGFLIDTCESALFIDTDQKSFNQYTADKVTKRDLVINFRKPRSNELCAGIEITGEETPTTFGDKVQTIISDYLGRAPGITKDRIYDEVVSRMVRAGDMEVHNFEELLSQIAEPIRVPVKKNLFEDREPDLFGTHEEVRWYLKRTQLDIVDEAESHKEDAAAGVLARVIDKKLENEPELDGVHYSDLFEGFVYKIADKPRRPLVEWLLDYFYKTDSGRYRLPATPEEMRVKAEGRAKGTSRHIKRYLAYLEQGVAVPEHEQPNDATLAEWIRHAKRSGMYEAGKLLFEKGGLSPDRLPEEAAVNVEEDYQVCVRMLARGSKG
jgi:16S rRNA G966 N2-methylase RsmD